MPVAAPRGDAFGKAQIHALWRPGSKTHPLAILQDQSRPGDIVISDLDMPGMDSMAFVRHLGESGISVSIILASAFDRKLLASIQTMSEAYGINLLGVLEKPISAEKLLPLIARHRALPGRSQNPTGPVFSVEETLEGLENDEFEPYYQPKIEMATRKVSGAESLTRWRHP